MDNYKSAGLARNKENKIRFFVCVAGFDGACHKPLGGAVFELEGGDGCGYASVSDAHGKAAFYVPPGSYKLRERTAPEGYIESDAVYTVIVHPDGTAFIDGKPSDAFPPIRNVYDPSLKGIKLQKGTLAFMKADDAGCPLPGCAFVLMNRQTCDIMKTKSDSRGRVIFRNIKRGSYTMTETDVPEGYCLSPATHTITVDKAGNVKLDGMPASEVACMCFENYAYPGPGELSFYVANDVGEYLEGSIFAMRDNGARLYEAASNAEGMVRFTGLSEGTYTLEQITAPADYNPSEMTFTVNVGSDKTVIIGDRPAREFMSYVFINPSREGYKATFSISIINEAGEGLCGAQFMLYDQNLAPAFCATSDEDGMAVFRNISYGSYILRETCPPDGYRPFTAALPVIIAWDGRVYIAGQPSDCYPPIISRRKHRRGEGVNTSRHVIKSGV